MEREIDNSDRRIKFLLSHHNYTSWYKRILEESINQFGVYQLLSKGLEPDFEVDPPDYRIKAISIGDSYTPDKNVKDGYIIDDRGNFIIIDDRGKNLKEKVYLQKLAEMSSRKEKFEASKRNIKRIIIQSLSIEIKDMLQNEGETFNNLMMGNDLLELLKLIKKCATGRGTSSVVIDGQRLMNMVLMGDSPSMVLKTINEFTEGVEQLKDNRNDSEIV